MQAERATGRPQERLLNAPSLPEGCGRTWEHFLHLHSRRGSTGFGPARITDHDLDAFQRVHGVRLSAFDIDAIVKADDAFFASLPKPKAGK